mmetsp:Transcript_4314/g.4830  ORF Transcript_4314/g.4830 Transcript_4314/m.4830 type:complete len:120 (-) Transcript_4314:714-1073(-)
MHLRRESNIEAEGCKIDNRVKFVCVYVSERKRERGRARAHVKAYEKGKREKSQKLLEISNHKREEQGFYLRTKITINSIKDSHPFVAEEIQNEGTACVKKKKKKERRRRRAGVVSFDVP